MNYPRSSATLVTRQGNPVWVRVRVDDPGSPRDQYVFWYGYSWYYEELVVLAAQLVRDYRPFNEWFGEEAVELENTVLQSNKLLRAHKPEAIQDLMEYIQELDAGTHPTCLSTSR